MSTVILFVGGVSPRVTNEEFQFAFEQQQAPLLATSIVRQPGSENCIGQAYVTVETRHAPAAERVTEVGGNAVAVFRVALEAWVAQPEPQPYNVSMPSDPRLVAAAAGPGPSPAHGHMGTPTMGTPGMMGTPTAAHSGASGSMLMSSPAVGPGAGAGLADYGVGTLPSTPHPNLQAVFDQLRGFLQSNPRVAFSGKPYYMLLHEACQKRQLTLQVFDSTEGLVFSSNITVLSKGQIAVCSGRAVGSNKKDAKHNAAAACLENMLATAQITSSELMSALTSTSTGASATPMAAIPDPAAAPAGAATTAMVQTQAIMRLGMYPRCSEVMQQVHSTEAGRIKTVLMVLNEYAVRSRVTVHHEEVTLGGVVQPAGPFRFQSRITDSASGAVLAQATGAELRSKQEAKQASAAALIEFLVTNGIATVEAVARGR